MTTQSPENVPSEEQSACNNDECGWIGQTDRMCGGIGPLCPDCGETTTVHDAAPATVGVPHETVLKLLKEQFRAFGSGRLSEEFIDQKARAMLAASPTPPAGEGQEPVGTIVLFGGDLKEVSWTKGEMPSPGTKLYRHPAPQAAQGDSCTCPPDDENGALCSRECPVHGLRQVAQPAQDERDAWEILPTDADAVDHFAAAMKEKLALARAKGRSGWHECDPIDLSAMLREHVEKGDPRDVANFCMFLWSLGKPISAALSTPPMGNAKDSIYVDAGHLREVLNGNDMPIYASSEPGPSEGRLVELRIAAIAAMGREKP